MRLLCPHCRTLADRDQFVIKRSEARLYGGGKLVQAVHRACKKVTLFPEQTARTAGLVKL